MAARCVSRRELPVSAMAESESRPPAFTLASLCLADIVRCTEAVKRAGSGAGSSDEAATRIVRLLYDMLRLRESLGHGVTNAFASSTT